MALACYHKMCVLLMKRYNFFFVTINFITLILVINFFNKNNNKLQTKVRQKFNIVI